MTAPAILLLVVLGAVISGLVILLLAPEKKEVSPVPSADTAGSIVTVRRVGPVTSVTFHEARHDYSEGVPYPSTEAARRFAPELYAEYLSPTVSAIRKYEILDELYALGFTLPYIKGLHEQYKRELREALTSGDPDARAAHECTPVDLTALRKAPIDNDLRKTPFPDMGEDPYNENQ